jgi:hypothetical protein
VRLSVHDAALYKDIDHILKSEHECTPLRLPTTMAVHGYLSLAMPIRLLADCYISSRGVHHLPGGGGTSSPAIP